MFSLAIVSRGEDGHERVRVNTRQGMASVRKEGNAVNLIPSSPAVHLAVALSYAMSASGRKRTLIPRSHQQFERPLSGKADIKLISDKGSANDPKRTLGCD